MTFVTRIRAALAATRGGVAANADRGPAVSGPGRGRPAVRGAAQQHVQLPGLALLDANARAAWIYRGNALGDYPPIDRVLSNLRGMSADRALSR